MKKILICGLGSIGQRHTRQIQKITHGNCELGALRIRKKNIVITDDLKEIKKIPPEEEYKLKIFNNIEDAMKWKPDVVLVTNPISMHINTAIFAAKAGAKHVYGIEMAEIHNAVNFIKIIIIG